MRKIWARHGLSASEVYHPRDGAVGAVGRGCRLIRPLPRLREVGRSPAAASLPSSILALRLGRRLCARRLPTGDPPTDRPIQAIQQAPAEGHSVKTFTDVGHASSGGRGGMEALPPPRHNWTNGAVLLSMGCEPWPSSQASSCKRTCTSITVVHAHLYSFMYGQR